MCGIAGFAGRPAPNGAGSGEAVLRGMCDAIRHRGPDDAGYLVDGDLGIGMRRLSIIDVSGGHQPMTNEDGSVHLVFNGEIYNFRDLRARLARNGHRLVTHSDTETIVHLYEEMGERLLGELRGMFGIAIWDQRRQRLLVARDRIGIKPMYYWSHGGALAFASEQRSLLTLPDFPRALDPDAVAQYFALGYVPEPLSIFAGVRKLPPGHFLIWERGQPLRVERYWSPIRTEVAIDPREAVEETRRLLFDAVKCHLESDVPLGAFLSGGIDSSGVVAAMAKQMDQPVKTFSIGFREAAFDESPFAAEVAKSLGTDHTELIVDPDVEVLIDEVVRGFDEPFADSSAIPTYLVSQLARRHVTVALSGDGGDELFGGYTRYAELLRAGGPAPGAVRGVARGVGLLMPHAAPGRNWLLNKSRTREGQYASTVALPASPREGGVLREELAARLGPFESLLERWFAPARGRDFATQMMLVDLESYLPGDILTKVDRMSMAPSLEARVPVLDHLMIEFAVSLPSSLKMRDGEGKWVLRRAIEPLVPATVLNRPKRGFAVPLVRWFTRELAHHLTALLEPSSAIYAYVDPAAVRRIVTEHRIGRRDHSTMLWRLLVLDLWLKFLARGDLAQPLTSGAEVSSFLARARTVGATTP
jgi:asparagine synthase (glutamine-hydrolysing)